MTAPLGDAALAHDLARSAGELLLDLQNEARETGILGWPLEDQGDAIAHQHLLERLSAERPDDAVLSEEGHGVHNRLTRDRTWVVDPLDGTEGFGRGVAEWAVHVALTIGGEPAVGAVSIPHLGLVASSHSPVGRESGDRRRVVVTGRSRAWVDGERVARAIDAELASCGSAGVKAMLVATGRADVYVHAGPLYEWDACAPAIVADACGLVAVAPDGTRLRFNQPEPVVPGLVISTPELVEDVLAALGV
ncbi:MAG: 3'(2'),5'-bisphosphate nucleotidase CysQ [Acidimicrobiales bacterium]